MIKLEESEREDEIDVKSTMKKRALRNRDENSKRGGEKNERTGREEGE